MHRQRAHYAFGSNAPCKPTIVFAKLLGAGVAAFIFDVTRPQLLKMASFVKLYHFVIALHSKATALVEPIRLRISQALRLIQRFRKSVYEARTDVEFNATDLPIRNLIPSA
jgi:hypothetical protein